MQLILLALLHSHPQNSPTGRYLHTQILKPGTNPRDAGEEEKQHGDTQLLQRICLDKASEYGCEPMVGKSSVRQALGYLIG